MSNKNYRLTRTTLTVLLLIAFFANTIAQTTWSENQDTISVQANWKKGDQKTFLITRTKQKKVSGDVRENFQFSFLADMKIVDSTESGYRVEWEYRLTNDFKEKNPLASLAMPVYNDMKMIFTTYTDGSFKDLLNWQEVADAYIEMTELNMGGQKNDTIKKTMDKVKEMFRTKEMTESSLIRELQLYYSAFGGVFTLKGMKSNTTLPNPINAEPLPAYIEQKIKEIKPAEGTFNVEISQSIKPEAMRNLLYGLLEKMDIPRDSIELEMEKMLQSLIITDKGTFTIDQTSGWLLGIEYIREAQFGEMYQKELILFELVKDKKEK